MRIALDAMGGDHAPAATVEGAAHYASGRGLPPGSHDAIVALVGDAERIRPELARHAPPPGRIDIVAASQVVDMDESPVRALRRKADSSLAIAVDLVARREAAGIVSAGNTGALVALAASHLGLIEGVDRPAIAAFLPSAHGHTVLVDAGANADCRPQVLRQFALMGSAYAEYVLGRTNPRVALLSIGEEPSKGNEVTKAAHALLSETPINFVGNVEGNTIFRGEVDVAICDGFVGNIALKVAEGIGTLVAKGLKDQLMANPLRKLGALLSRPAFEWLKQRTYYGAYGGALLLGVNGVCLVCHGRSSSAAIARAVQVAEECAQNGIVEHIRRACAEAPSEA
jgi:glycerol-3-phosphate acyltransferase PlsX